MVTPDSSPFMFAQEALLSAAEHLSVIEAQVAGLDTRSAAQANITQAVLLFTAARDDLASAIEALAGAAFAQQAAPCTVEITDFTDLDTGMSAQDVPTEVRDCGLHQDGLEVVWERAALAHATVKSIFDHLYPDGWDQVKDTSSWSAAIASLHHHGESGAQAVCSLLWHDFAVELMSERATLDSVQGQIDCVVIAG